MTERTNIFLPAMAGKVAKIYPLDWIREICDQFQHPEVDAKEIEGAVFAAKVFPDTVTGPYRNICCYWDEQGRVRAYIRTGNPDRFGSAANIKTVYGFDNEGRLTSTYEWRQNTDGMYELETAREFIYLDARPLEEYTEKLYLKHHGWAEFIYPYRPWL